MSAITSATRWLAQINRLYSRCVARRKCTIVSHAQPAVRRQTLDTDSFLCSLVYQWSYVNLWLLDTVSISACRAKNTRSHEGMDVLMFMHIIHSGDLGKVSSSVCSISHHFRLWFDRVQPPVIESQSLSVAEQFLHASRSVMNAPPP